jgi:hypothetical protein
MKQPPSLKTIDQISGRQYHDSFSQLGITLTCYGVFFIVPAILIWSLFF